MTDTTIPTSEVLYRAADHIAVFGHCNRGGYEIPDGGSLDTSPVCIIGAITVVEGRAKLDYYAAVGAVQRYLGAGIVWWNDATNRTAAEVIATLRAAAVIEAAKENADAEAREQVSA